MQSAADRPPGDYARSGEYRAPQRPISADILHPSQALGAGLKPMKTILPVRDQAVAPTTTQSDNSPTTQQGFQAQLNDSNMSVTDYIDSHSRPLEEKLQSGERSGNPGRTQSAPQNYAPPQPPTSSPRPDAAMIEVYNAMDR
jgi:hypothetical protein